MFGVRRLRRVAAMGGIATITVLGALGTAPAGGQSGRSPLEILNDKHQMNFAAIEVAHYYGDYSYDAEVGQILGAVNEDYARGRVTDPKVARRAWELAGQAYDKYYERVAIDAAGGQERYDLAKTAAGFVAPAGCSNDQSFLWGMNHLGELIDTDARDRKASVTIVLDQPLCQPVKLTLLSFAKPGDRPWPAPQRFQDSDTETLSAAGTYTLEVDIPTIFGLLCAAQIDLAREASFGRDGAIGPALIDAAQYDVATPKDREHELSNLLGSDICATPPTAVGPNVTAKPAAITASAGFYDPGVQGTLPYTGSNTVPLVALSVGLIALGWVFLAGKSALKALEERADR